MYSDCTKIEGRFRIYDEYKHFSYVLKLLKLKRDRYYLYRPTL